MHKMKQLQHNRHSNTNYKQISLTCSVKGNSSARHITNLFTISMQQVVFVQSKTKILLILHFFKAALEEQSAEFLVTKINLTSTRRH